MRILVIEDEPRMLQLLRRGLSEHGHDVMVAVDGPQALKVTLDHEFDVVLLDVGLPGLSGYDVAQVLRERKYSASILMLTAFNKEDEIVRGLNLGADDYLTKPFSFPELLARLRAVTRPVPEAASTIYELDDLTIDRAHRKVCREGRSIELTKTEFTLLELLVHRIGQVAPRRVLIEGIWGIDSDIGHGALDVLVNSLRSKLDAPFHRRLIHTARGQGYSLHSEAGGPETMTRQAAIR
ncbi:DNA-binding heavy metal response regulator [Acidisarcina polymorpha]|uniref:DNA-binding heavy metal response regulator n=1 Tax=Acidisarcina polymorpha TaxID=2211140 RepID=A0A2Z5G2H3_9BACT|nr:response regulator transcription factor [Acidisarcina polymorpha]AXC13014.1 DNA-binding heavy metal response regulator [Acidisarcina polymorpha]